ncbi:HNH endonuclease [Candidatus Saccharibacteria bacterium]|nr:HNH endonuclease [Candidatus Saccharibacteria bacterium]
MKLRMRRLVLAMAALVGVGVWLVVNPASYETVFTRAENSGTNYAADAVTEINEDVPLASDVLEKLEVKGRAPKTGYSRDEFYSGWPTVEGCNLRQKILKREFGDSAVLDGCNVVAGEYDEPYTGEHKKYTAREEISKGVQIDHVVALSDAWQKGAQYMEREVRYSIATDPLNLLAVDAAANEKKSDGDAATWLPANKRFRCQYVARQASVKYKYGLWVTEAEKEAMSEVLANCPNEPSVGV